MNESENEKEKETKKNKKSKLLTYERNMYVQDTNVLAGVSSGNK